MEKIKYNLYKIYFYIKKKIYLFNLKMNFNFLI